MNNNHQRAKWMPIFFLAVILLFIYNILGNFTSFTGEIARFIGVMSPLLYGILFSYFLYIPHNLFEKLISKIGIKFIKKQARLLATLFTFILVVIVVAMVVSYLLPIIFSSLLDLASSIPGYVTFVQDFLDTIPDEGIWSLLNVMDSVTENAGDFVTGFINTALIEQLALGVVSFAGELLSIVLGLVISLYILLDRERIARFLSGLSNALFKKEKVRLRVNRYTYQIHKTLFTFIASKGLDSIINIIVVTTILLIFDVPYAVLLGLMAGVLNFIPYLGSLIAVIIISLITIITGGFAQALQVVIPLFVFQQLDGNYIEPRIMKSSLKINPILVIIAVVVGGAYFGVLGMFLAVPIAVIIKQILLEYIHNAEHFEADEDHNELPPN